MKVLKLISGLTLLSLSYGTIQSTTAQENRQEKLSSTYHRPPIMGWASWNQFHVSISENIIKSQADAMVNNGLVDFGYKYINIDDGFWGGRDKNGSILPHPQRFPNGLKNLAQYIHSKGLKAGIYTDAGINTCASHYDKDTIGAGMGLYGHDEQDLRIFLQEWDYDFLKVDWCGANWLGLDEEMRYTGIGELARRIKPSVGYNVCRWEFPGKWVTQVADSWRIAGDLHASFTSVLKTIDANADLWMYASSGHYNDMDMLQVGRGMTTEEDKTHFTMWCLMHSPLLLGNDLTKMTKQTLHIVTNQELININQSPFVYQARRLIDYGEVEVWGRPLVSTMSGEVVVALLNRSDSIQTVSISLNKIGLTQNNGYSIVDLWTKENFPTSTAAEISREIPAHGVVALKINGTAQPFNVFQFKDNK